MAKRRSPDNQAKALPEYGELVSIMQDETASILTDYIRQYVGIASRTPEPGAGIYFNFDRVLNTQSYKELAWYDLYQEVERDPHVAAIMMSAKLNVAGMPWDVEAFTAKGQKKPSARNEEIAAFVRDTLLATGYFPQHIYNLMNALGKGFSVSEIVWRVDTSVTVDRIMNRPQRRFQFDASDRSLRLRTLKTPYFGEPLPDKKFIVHRVSSEWENPFGDALDQSLYWMWLFKKTVTKYWIQHLNVGASSIPIVRHPRGDNAALKAEALSIAQQIRNGAYGRIPEGFEIIWAEAKNAIQNAEAYDRFVGMCDDQMSKAVNGQTLTSEAGGENGTGSRALGDVHQGTQTARDVFRAKGMEATLNASLVRWLVDFNFASVDGYPRFRFDLEDPEDLERESRIVQNLNGAGYDFDAEELSEKFNYTLVKKQPLNLAAQKPEDAEPEAEESEEPEAIEGA